MTNISAGTPNLLSSLPKISVSKRSAEQEENIDRVLRAEPPPVGQVNADNAPENLYARITKNGKVIAEVYKGGLVARPNAVDLPELTNEASDPAQLKDIRIKEILDFTGGEVEYIDASRTAAGAQQAKTLFETQLFASR